MKLSDLTPLQLADERVKLLAALKDARDELLVVAAELGESEDGIPALYRAISAIADAEAPTP